MVIDVWLLLKLLILIEILEVFSCFECFIRVELILFRNMDFKILRFSFCCCVVGNVLILIKSWFDKRLWVLMFIEICGILDNGLVDVLSIKVIVLCSIVKLIFVVSLSIFVIGKNVVGESILWFGWC